MAGTLHEYLSDSFVGQRRAGICSGMIFRIAHSSFMWTIVIFSSNSGRAQDRYREIRRFCRAGTIFSSSFSIFLITSDRSGLKIRVENEMFVSYFWVEHLFNSIVSFLISFSFSGFSFKSMIMNFFVFTFLNGLNIVSRRRFFHFHSRLRIRWELFSKILNRLTMTIRLCINIYSF